MKIKPSFFTLLILKIFNPLINFFWFFNEMKDWNLSRKSITRPAKPMININGINTIEIIKTSPRINFIKKESNILL